MITNIKRFNNKLITENINTVLIPAITVQDVIGHFTDKNIIEIVPYFADHIFDDDIDKKINQLKEKLYKTSPEIIEEKLLDAYRYTPDNANYEDYENKAVDYLESLAEELFD